MTVGQLLELYFTHHLSAKVSGPYYGRLIRQVYPALAEHDVWWRALWDRPGHANKALGLFRSAHRWALGLGLLTGVDPTAGLIKRPEHTRCTTTSPEEWARLLPFLEDLKLRHRVYFWSLYLLGSRPSEVRLMRPDQLALDRAQPVWIKPTTKTNRPHIVPLPAQLVPLLRLLMRANPPGTLYLFWGHHPRAPWCRTSAQKMWEGLRAKAGLSHLWMNDLRRSTASDLLNQGESLGVVQGALNHRSLSQTAKYAYLAVTPLATALQDRADHITGQLPHELETYR